ncbi:phosphoribosyltransferase [Legionella micdadei]|uniref:Phosphoribosyltransferase n=1 Tax=Legionella micdadei TaxID=451 RepID=A0A098GDD2_LEGMI|nr:phosphoribosyltransferase [Legionella micdadei]ARG97883.1 phosphoribosyl transferase [Legionella micdadei]ARG99797.1 phosphoribosyl transferase [Legionella micdadei]KTD28604.1 phosphoribosyltransferase [Legionella micdadei]NSL19195.1 phosphoribosyltransferase [Legionella micdadei]CEG60503.1 Phosphoribosyltransferase [Legionella micdadei]
MEKFIDRYEAGTMLAGLLEDYAHKPNTIVLALPRGGVPVAYEVAATLSIPLEVFIVRKLGVPGHEELAMGAIATGGTVFFNQEILDSLNLPEAAIQRVIKAEEAELERRESVYRKGRPPLKITGKTIILVDDGVATGATMFAALKALRQLKPASIIVAVPVAAQSTCEELTKLADKLVCPLRPVNFYAVGLWYEDFSQTTDEEVFTLLTKAHQKSSSHLSTKG